ncbi:MULTISPECIES: glycoside hydrolase family 113 [unclassified Tenacibaculum]|uniref:glycoside hydrolase family 113 n=1 Tax=unclassified Tenacibaculum TaxID=2635139 RepID=UPI001F435BF1|nr:MULTISPECIES: glycoside hydrolase [unclassified Tenacibaculum]MCF2874594.1 glycoside hydrolase [Tenacibaculum sp. Cn5-1]MCF2934340.1 glycoside hydrolase [Tenacibaculum sp. Cn5-34]MCG7510550.1 glycoside hydrolase [Tenacibaculum sp. Cn5-46]
MKIYKLLLVCLICLSCKSQTKKINGISFVASPEKISHEHVSPLIKASANYVALMPFGFIKDLSSPEVIHNTKRQWFGETEEGIIQYAKEFQKKGISLMIKPQIWVWRGEFTGYIKMNSEENWKALEASYLEFILTYAKTAQRLKADVFCIGTELEKFVINRPEFWNKLIKEVRKVYKGKLTYAANWDEFKRVPFWEDIDYIGIDAYFPLSEKKSPTLEEFEKGWEPHKKEILRVREKVNKPVLFTEYGYRSINYAGKKPWEAHRVEGEINLENQKNATQALYNQFWKEDWFAGGFIWKWFHKHKEVGGKNNNRFTPQNKPTEELIRKLYAQ